MVRFNISPINFQPTTAEDVSRLFLVIANSNIKTASEWVRLLFVDFIIIKVLYSSNKYFYFCIKVPRHDWF